MVENIVENQKNYLNLRLDFEKFKASWEEIISDTKKYLNGKTIKSYMENYFHAKILHWTHIFTIAREISLKKDDQVSFFHISQIMKNFTMLDYFQTHDCQFQCHISSRFLQYLHHAGFDSSKVKVNELFNKHMNIESSHGYFQDVMMYYNPCDGRSYHLHIPPCSILNFANLCYHDDIKEHFPYILDNKISEIRNLNFKILSFTKKFMIYLEKNVFNTDLIELDQKKIEFLQYYLKLTQFKYKMMIIFKNSRITIDSKKYNRIEKNIRKCFTSVDLDWLDSANSTDDVIVIRNSNLNSNSNNRHSGSPTSSPQTFRKDLKKTPTMIFDAAFKSEGLVLDTSRESNLKMENTQIIESFLNGAIAFFKNCKVEVELFYLKKGVDMLRKENLAFKEYFSQARNDLDISKFKNKFSSNMIQELDDTQIGNINRKFPFFEAFVNKVQNISLEVETHGTENAILIKKDEYQDALRNLIKDFMIYDTNITRSNHFSYCSEKFGYYFTIKKLEIWITSLKNKLQEYDYNMEKISNAKLALTGNKLVYEMDNLYRQLKVLKDNISIMEEYIRNYFEDKYNTLIHSFKTEINQMESKFHEFKNSLMMNTVQNITEEYSNCLTLLKEKTKYYTTVANKISFVDNTEEMEFYDHFYRELGIEQNYCKELVGERKRIEGLNDDIAKLHGYYRMKLHNQKVNYETDLDNFKQILSSNKDLWDKLAIAEKNEIILKEELAKTQKSLAAAEEFIKKLQSQIRKSHDKNVNLEKQISAMSVKEIISNSTKGTNVKAMELYCDIRQNYVYNMKNNINLITALDRIKAKYKDDEDITLVLNNFEMLHQRYAQEVDNKRNYISALEAIKEDVERMKILNCKKMEDQEKTIEDLKKENSELKFTIGKLKVNTLTQSSNLSISRHSGSQQGNNYIQVKESTELDKLPSLVSQKISGKANKVKITGSGGMAIEK